MDKFTVSEAQGVTVISAVEHNLKLRVLAAESTTLPGNTAVIEATLYVEQGGFVPKRSYFFELIADKDVLPTEHVSVDIFKAMVDFFFNHVLGTDLFVKSIPRASVLCPAERRGYEFY